MQGAKILGRCNDLRGIRVPCGKPPSDGIRCVERQWQELRTGLGLKLLEHIRKEAR